MFLNLQNWKDTVLALMSYSTDWKETCNHNKNGLAALDWQTILSKWMPVSGVWRPGVYHRQIHTWIETHTKKDFDKLIPGKISQGIVIQMKFHTRASSQGVKEKKKKKIGLKYGSVHLQGHHPCSTAGSDQIEKSFCQFICSEQIPYCNPSALRGHFKIMCTKATSVLSEMLATSLQEHERAGRQQKLVVWWVSSSERGTSNTWWKMQHRG